MGPSTSLSFQDLAKTAEYRAVAPTADQVNTAAERRRLAIQESKFLGGDMEHTHLVKGLDFALLQKVRSEIAVNESEAAETEDNDTGDKEKEDPAAEVDFVSIQGRKIYKVKMSLINNRGGGCHKICGQVTSSHVHYYGTWPDETWYWLEYRKSDRSVKCRRRDFRLKVREDDLICIDKCIPLIHVWTECSGWRFFRNRLESL